jgi:hypothetical protein
MNLKNPVVIFFAGMVVAYAFRRVLDEVPLFNKIPTIRL